MAQFVHKNRERSSQALDTALVELWRSFVSQDIDGDVRAAAGLGCWLLAGARGARRQAPTAQYGELGQAKAQARTRVVEAKFSYIRMSVGRVLDASPQTARGSRGPGAILRRPTPKNRYQKIDIM